MSWRDQIAKMLVSNTLTGAEARRAEALASRVEPTLPFPRRTDLTTDAYHGTNRVFNQFMPWTMDEAGSMDRALGTHAAKDPALSSEAFAMRGWKPADYNKLGAAEYDNLNEKPLVIPLKIPDEDRFLQAKQPLVYPGGLETPLWRRARTDTTAIENMIAEQTFRKEPDTLKEYLERGRAVDPSQSRVLARDLAAGESVPLPYTDKNYDLLGLVDNFMARPYDQQHAVDTARDVWQGQGYRGIRYINTAPNEAGAKGVTDPTSYIIFNPADIRSRFAGFAGDPESLRSPDLMRGVVAAPIGALGATYDPNQYEAPP